MAINDKERIQKIMTTREKKQKKVKTPKEEYLISTGKKRLIKRPSVISETVSELIKLGYDTPVAINKYFTENSRVIDNQQRKLYETLVKARIYEGRFMLTDDLANASFNLYVLTKGYKTKTISNDWLWLSLAFNREVDSVKENINTYMLDMLNKSRLSEVIIVSDPWVCGKDIKKGYYQDYYAGFACIGMSELSENDRKTIVNADESYKFRIGQLKFIAKGTSGSCVIWREDEKLTNNVILNRIDDTKIISVKEGKVALNAKNLSIKNEQVKYVCTKVKPEKFCPAFLQSEEVVVYHMFFTSTLEYNSLFDILDKCFKETKQISFYENSWYWTNTESWFQFLSVYSITSKELTAEGKVKIAEISDFYYKYKDVFMAWKKCQLMYEKILREFYLTFLGKINWDKVTGLYKRITDYIDFRDFLMFDESYSEISTWINNQSYCLYIKNQFSNEIMKIADKMKNVLYDITQKRNVDNIVEKLKEVGRLIYLACPACYDDLPGESFKPAFPMILGIGSFMGFLWDDASRMGNPLKDNVDKLLSKAESDETKNARILSQFGDFLSNMKDYREKVIAYNINRVGESEGVNFNAEELKVLTDNVIKEIMKDVKTADELSIAIFNAAKAGKSYNDLVIDSGSFLNYIKKFALQKKNNINNAVQLNQQYDNQINQLQQRKAENSQYISNLQSNNPVSNQNFPQVSVNIPNISSRSSQDQPMLDINTAESGILDLDDEVIKNKTSKWYNFNVWKNSVQPTNKDLVRYYANVIYHSNLYNNVNNPEALTSLDINTLLQQYPISPTIFEAVVVENNLPNPGEMFVKKFDYKKVPYKKYDYTDTLRATNIAKKSLSLW